ncbi:MAG TPA: hypothetical protein VNS09_01975, partial [Solirubrobacter sp.]|nr:hypothetical protein [Solirubrobacter sp.]
MAPPGPVRVARKAVAAEPPRPAVRRVARVTEPPIVPVEPAPPVEAAPEPAPAEPEPRRGLFRRVVDAFRGEDGEANSHVGAEAADDARMRVDAPAADGIDGASQGVVSRAVAPPRAVGEPRGGSAREAAPRTGGRGDVASGGVGGTTRGDATSTGRTSARAARTSAGDTPAPPGAGPADAQAVVARAGGWASAPEPTGAPEEAATEDAAASTPERGGEAVARQHAAPSTPRPSGETRTIARQDAAADMPAPRSARTSASGSSGETGAVARQDAAPSTPRPSGETGAVARRDAAPSGPEPRNAATGAHGHSSDADTISQQGAAPSTPRPGGETGVIA